jgi:Na+/H+-dicarboxylate symporter
MVVKSQYRTLYLTLGGMLLGLMAGAILRAGFSAEICDQINVNVLTRLVDLFIRTLKIIVTPLVFFSIASSIATLGDVDETGRIGGKILATFLIGSAIAVGIGIGVFYIFGPGNPSLMGVVDTSYTIDTSSAENVSLLDTILNIVPGNIVNPFSEGDMLQIIFLAVACGIGAATLEKHKEHIRMFLGTFNELFLKIMTAIVKLIPLIAFCSMASLVINTDIKSLLSILQMALVVLVGMFLMAVVYAVVLALSGISPIRFFKKYMPTMLQVFAISSSKACIPLNMKVCEEKLGIPSRVYSMAIPLGATVNMHGLCVYLAVISLSFIRISGGEITPGKIVTMIITILLMAMGAPGIPGANIVVLAVVCVQLNINVALISLIMGIDPLIDMFGTAMNCMGDIITSLLVAKSENILDMEVFNKP